MHTNRVVEKFSLGNETILKLLKKSFAAHCGLTRLEGLVSAVIEDTYLHTKKKSS